MSKEKQEITWFEPFSEKEASSNDGSGLLRRFLKRPQRSRVEIDAQKQSVKFEKSTVENKPTSSSSEVESTGGESTNTAAVYSSPPRTLSTVIDRFDTLGRSKGDSVLTKEDLKKYWMPDNACKECFHCGLKFTISRRKHHCRVCGQIFCSSCCYQMIDGRMLRVEGLLRVCNSCLHTVFTAEQSPRHHANAAATNQLERSMDDTSLMRPDLPQSDSPVNRRLSMRSFASWETGVNPQLSVVESSPQHVASTGFFLYGAEEEQLLAIEKDAIKFGAHEIWLQLMDPIDGLKLQSHRYRLMRYPNTLTAVEIIDWLIKNEHASSREMAVRLGQTLIDTKRLIVVNADQVFRDESHLFLEIGPLGNYELQGEDVHMAAGIFTQQEDDTVVVTKMPTFGGNYRNSNLAMIMASQDVVNSSNREEMSQGVTKATTRQPSTDSNNSPIDVEKSSQFSIIEQNDIYQCIFSLTTDVFNDETLSPYSSPLDATSGALPSPPASPLASPEETAVSIDKCCKKHVNNILYQLLCVTGLSSSWYHVIQPLIMEAGYSVKPDVAKGDTMDVCDYVRIKKIPGGCMENSSLIYGVVCTKNVTNKRMKTSFQKPRILLLTCSVELERSENKLSSFDQLRSQEYEYLKNLVARIFTHKPDIILVQGSVAKIAQDMLFDLGVTLVINVKESVMRRVSRLTQGDLLTSVDQLMLPIQLGTCGQFYLKSFYLPQGGKKTLMCFDQCAEHLGCCIILQGASTRELRKVKAVFKFAVLAAYNACLETEYLCSSFSSLPLQKASVEDTKYKSLLCVLSHSPDGSLYPCVNWPTTPADAATDTPDIHSCAATIEKCIEDDYRHKMSTVTETGVANSESAKESLPTFADALDGQILSISPHIKFDLPHLMSKATVPEDIRQYLPAKMYWSNLFKPSVVTSVEDTDLCEDDNYSSCSYNTPTQEKLLFTSINPWEKPPVGDEYYEARSYISAASHPFTTCPLLFTRDSKEMKTIVADYRARAGQPNSERFFFKLAQTSSILDNQLVYMAGAAKNNYKKLKLETPFKCEDVVSKKSHTAQLRHRPSEGTLRFSLSEDTMAASTTDVDRTSWVESETAVKMEPSFQKKKRDNVDCLLIQNHQSISFLYWSTSRQVHPGKCYSCMTPMHVTLPYYVANDLSLGEFLEQMCFKSGACPTCHHDAFSHQTHFVHSSSCLRLNVYRLPHSIPGSNDIIYNWHQCKKCQQHTPHMELSSDALSYSFAKFLELKFYDRIYIPQSTGNSQLSCQHPLNQMHIQCFCQNDIVAVLDLVPINLLEIVLPPKKIAMLKHNSQEHNDWSEDIKFVSRVVEGVFHRIKERLLEYGNDPSLANIKDDYIAIKLKEDHEEYHNKLKSLRELAVLGGFFPSSLLLQHHLTDLENYEVLMKLQDEMFMLKRSLMGTVGMWNKQLEVLYDFIHNPPQNSSRSSKQSSSRSSPVNLENCHKSETTEAELSQEVIAKQSSLVNISHSVSSPSPSVVDRHQVDDDATVTDYSQSGDDISTPTAESVIAKFSKGHKRSRSNTMDYSHCSVTTATGTHRRSSSFDVNLLVHEKTNKSTDNEIDSNSPLVTMKSDKQQQQQQQQQQEQQQWQQPPQEQQQTQVTTSDLFQDEVDFSSMFGKWKAKENDDPSNFYIIHKQQDGGSQHAHKQHTMKLLRGSSSTSLVGDSKKRATRHSKLLDADTPVRLLDRVSMFSRPVKFLPLPPPFKLSEHHTLRGDLRIPIAVYEKEPSSVIAYTLSSREYARELAKLQSVDKGNKKSLVTSNKAEEMGLTLTEATVNSTSVDAGVDAVADTSVPPKSNTKEYSHLKGTIQREHITLDFSDHAAKFSCKVYFAEEFRQLRQVVFSYGEERFIRSLARCVKWQARGGKSGSSFCKVVDDRFILKQMKKAEVESFVEIADGYFNHLRKAFDQNIPTALAKIVGVYHISMHNSQTNDSMEGDFLVIENLLYGHKCSKVFDLKGSMRSRYVQPGKEPAGESEVYLDENFLEYITVSPVYLRSHSGTVLMKAIQADTEFLSHNNVMDYSMLTGIDENNKELVLGIIDFVRAFTWDKMLEMWIKKYVGRGGRLPTVVSPDLYRKRFCEAMEKYFYQIPDKWTGMANKEM